MMRKLVIGSGMALVVLGGAASVGAAAEPTKAGAVAVTEGKGTADQSRCAKIKGEYKGEIVLKSPSMKHQDGMKHSDRGIKLDGVEGERSDRKAAPKKAAAANSDCSPDFFLK